MVTTAVFITLGNSASTETMNRFPTAALMAYSKTATTKLNDIDSGSSHSSEPSHPSSLDKIHFETCEGLAPIPSGMQIALLWLSQHPAKGYPAKYQGRKRLTVEIAEKLACGTIPFIGLLRVHEALLLIDLKDHLSRQFEIRNAIMEHMNKTVLTPIELHRLGMIFSHPTTADPKIISLAVNKTLDFIDDAIENSSLSQDDFDAYIAVCKVVPALKEKMTAAYEGKAARLAREQEKATRAAAYKVKHAEAYRAKPRKRAEEAAGLKANAKVLSELEHGEERPISDYAVSRLMIGPTVIKVVKARK
jgi:hypothetical protein